MEITLPKLGLTMEEGTVGEWLVADGEVVSTGEAILRIETDKVEVDIEAEADGVLRHSAAAGDVLVPGAQLGWVLAEGEQPPPGGGAAATPVANDDAGTDAVAPASGAEAATRGSATPAGGRLFASPNARRLARERDVPLTDVTGTGPGGRIVGEDVEVVADRRGTVPAPSAVREPTPARVPATSSDDGLLTPLVRRDAARLGVDPETVPGTGPGGRVRRADVAAAARTRETTIPLSGARGVIAKRMHASLQEMAQLTLGTDVEVGALEKLRAELKQQWSEDDLAVPSVTHLVLRAAALALRHHPLLNATVDETHVRLRSDINVGMAVASGSGLVVPVIHDAAGLPLIELVERAREVARRARNNELTLADLEDGTFTVSTLGGYGVDMFTPIVNPGQVGILGVGRIRDGVRWEGEVPKRSRVMTLSLTFDHRAVDGAPAADFLQMVGVMLGRPLSLLA
jgi:pyruvate/2-oxoglutarate dehydrogenase complex dihydrolipoamide acyltransferase (E2) component